MACSVLHLDCPGFDVSDLSIDPDTITVDAEPTAATATCPDCRQASDWGHSPYTRRIGDLPIQGKRLVIRLTLRGEKELELLRTSTLFKTPVQD